VLPFIAVLEIESSASHMPGKRVRVSITLLGAGLEFGILLPLSLE
jgi:hypothetical protein